MFTSAAIIQAARVYLGDTAPEHPLASPLYAALDGLLPVFIQVSDSEALRDDSVPVAHKIKAARGEVELHVWPGLPHAWPIFSPFLLEARQALEQAADFVRGALSAPPR